MYFLLSSKKLNISVSAKRDLTLIGEYTLREWGAVQKKRYLGLIKKCFKLIRENPTVGRQRDEIDMGLFSHAVQKHVVFYRIIKSDLFIVRVLHESMDLEQQLGSTIA